MPTRSSTGAQSSTQSHGSTIVSPCSGVAPISLPTEVQTTKRTANFPACGDAKRCKANDAITTSDPAAAPVIEHRGDRLQSCEESTAWSREDTLQHVIRSILPLQQRADSSRSNVESDKQSSVARPVGNMDAEGREPQAPCIQTNYVKQRSPSNAIEHVTRQTMGSQSVEGSQTDVQTSHKVTGSGRNGLESSETADSHVDSCPTDHNLPHFKSHPATSDSTQYSKTFLQTPCHSFSPPSGAPNSGITGPYPSNAAVTQSAQNLGQSCDSPEGCFEPQQRSEFTSSRRAINRSDKSGAYQPVATEEVDEVDRDVHTLGKQVKLARDIKVKREELAEVMSDLESRRRDAHLSLRTTLAEMDADIREHVRLSSNLERLQNLTEKREHEAAAILQRLNSRRDMASRIREEHQSHTDSIRRMESEFSSSGKELQGILQTLGILL